MREILLSNEQYYSFEMKVHLGAVQEPVDGKGHTADPSVKTWTFALQSLDSIYYLSYIFISFCLSAREKDIISKVFISVFKRKCAFYRRYISCYKSVLSSLEIFPVWSVYKYM